MTPDTLYIDPRRRFAVGYYADDAAIAGFSADTSDWDGIEGIAVLRAVTSLDDLQEKIAILDEDLDDVAVERMKFFMARLLRPGMHLERRDLRFAGRDRVPAWRDDVENGRLHFTYYLKADRAMVDTEIPILWYYDQLYACTIDPRMTLYGDGAHMVNGTTMLMKLATPIGKVYPYFRESKADETGMMFTRTTFRRTASHPTVRLSGLAHEGGFTLFPPIFDSIEHARWGNSHFVAFLNGTSGVVTPTGGFSDIFLRHLPPMPVVDMDKYNSDLDAWLTGREMRVYYRDSALAVPTDSDGDLLYQQGTFLRAGFFVDATTSLGRPAPGVRTRFMIISNRGVKLHDVPGIADQNPSLLIWDLTIFDYNAIFYVVDEYFYKGVRLIVLLHVPASLPGIANDNMTHDALGQLDRNYTGMWPEGSRAARVGELSVAAEEAFRAAMDTEEVKPLSMNADWRKRTEQLVGIAGERLISLTPYTETQNDTVEIVRDILDAEGGLDDVTPSFGLSSRPSPLYRGTGIG